MEPIEIWYQDLFKPFGPASFMPLMRLYETCVMYKTEINFGYQSCNNKDLHLVMYTFTVYA